MTEPTKPIRGSRTADVLAWGSLVLWLLLWVGIVASAGRERGMDGFAAFLFISMIVGTLPLLISMTYLILRYAPVASGPPRPPKHPVLTRVWRVGVVVFGLLVIFSNTSSCLRGKAPTPRLRSAERGASAHPLNPYG